MSRYPRFAVIVLLAAAWLAAGCSSEVKIGAVISETGAVAPYGHQVIRGLDLALEEINAEGGFDGAPVQLIYRDDATNPETGIEAVKDLIDNEKVNIIIGAVSSPVTLEIAPICEKEEVLLLSPTASAPRISEAGEYIFRNYPSDVLEGTALADFARKMGVRRVAIFALDNEFGSGLAEVFIRRFESRSREVVKTFRITEGDTASFPDMIQEIKGMTPQGVYVVAYEAIMAELLKQFKAAGCKGLVMGSGAVTDRLITEAGEAAEHLVYPQPVFDVDSAEPAVASFVQAFRAKYQREPDIYAAHGYDSLKLILAAMEHTGFTFPDEVRRGLHGLRTEDPEDPTKGHPGYAGAAGITQFDERGDVVRYPKIFVVHEGKSVPYEQFEQDGGELTIPDTSR
jgi:branched-chain amino acid transport system substrate-binding protein